jgi:hypothetical protein
MNWIEGQKKSCESENPDLVGESDRKGTGQRDSESLEKNF